MKLRLNLKPLESLLEIQESNPGFMQQLIDQYSTSSEQLLKNLEVALTKKDLHQIEMSSHTLVSSSRMLGLDEFAEKCSEIERTSQSKSIPTVEFSSLVDLYQKSLQDLREYLQKKV